MPKIGQPHSEFDVLQCIRGNSTRAIVSNCKNIWSTWGKSQKQQCTDSIRKYCCHISCIQSSSCFLFWSSDSSLLQEFNWWVCKGIGIPIMPIMPIMPKFDAVCIHITELWVLRTRKEKAWHAPGVVGTSGSNTFPEGTWSLEWASFWIHSFWFSEALDIL